MIANFGQASFLETGLALAEQVQHKCIINEVEVEIYSIIDPFFFIYT
jgi:hypothetical protein